MAVPFEIPDWLLPEPSSSPPPPVDDHRVEGMVNGFIAGKQDALFDAPDADFGEPIVTLRDDFGASVAFTQVDRPYRDPVYVLINWNGCVGIARTP